MSDKEVILLKYGEIVLKGLNRRVFEAQLLQDAKARLAPLGRFSFRYAQSTVTVAPREGSPDMDEAVRRLVKVFGVLSVTRALEVPKSLDALRKAAPVYCAGALLTARSFKVKARRSDKSFPLTSPELAAELGGVLAKAFPHLKADMHTPDVTITAEIRDFGAYLHTNPLPGAGGMPAGSAGRATLLISGGIDSPVAGFRMARRGIDLHAVHFFSFPYTGERAKEKVLSLLSLLSDYSGPIPADVVPFTEIQEQIRQHCREEYFTLVMRRIMMRIAGSLAQREQSRALITGESLGQVASQTLPALCATDDASPIPVFRPLIGMDKEEIVAAARKIGTFETSILPYEDCCTIFVPKHPKTRPELSDVIAEEQKLSVDALVSRAVESAERLVIRPSW